MSTITSTIFGTNIGYTLYALALWEGCCVDRRDLKREQYMYMPEYVFEMDEVKEFIADEKTKLKMAEETDTNGIDTVTKFWQDLILLFILDSPVFHENLQAFLTIQFLRGVCRLAVKHLVPETYAVGIGNVTAVIDLFYISP